MLKKKNDYEVGEKLICIKYFKTKSINVNKNFEYIITQITDKTFTLMDELTKDTLTLTLKQIETFFKHSYCYTCHSRQGSTIEKPITIHQWDFKYITRKWLYTAITRTTDLNNVYFMVNKNFNTKQNDDLETKALKNYFEGKIYNYLQQDFKAGRITRTEQIYDDGMKYIYDYDKNNFVNFEWLENSINKKCGCCGNGFNLEFYEDYPFVSSDLTAQRLDNNLPHYLDNTIPMCVNCNCSNK